MWSWFFLLLLSFVLFKLAPFLFKRLIFKHVICQQIIFSKNKNKKSNDCQKNIFTILIVSSKVYIWWIYNCRLNFHVKCSWVNSIIYTVRYVSTIFFMYLLYVLIYSDWDHRHIVANINKILTWCQHLQEVWLRDYNTILKSFK